MYHIFFIHSFVDGYLDCFHALAIVNSTAMDIGVHVSFSVMVSSGYRPVKGLLGHMVVLFLVFKEISILFSIVAISIYMPNSVRGFPFLHIFSRICCL